MTKADLGLTGLDIARVADARRRNATTEMFPARHISVTIGIMAKRPKRGLNR